MLVLVAKSPRSGSHVHALVNTLPNRYLRRCEVAWIAWPDEPQNDVAAFSESLYRDLDYVSDIKELLELHHGLGIQDYSGDSDVQRAVDPNLLIVLNEGLNHLTSL